METKDIQSKDSIRPSLLSLWNPKTHYRQTRKGKILQSVSELYLRDDLGLGFIIPSTTSAKRNNVSIRITGAARMISSPKDLLIHLVSAIDNTRKTRLVVVDTNVLLHNADVLEHPSCAIGNMVIPQTSLLECRNRSFTAYGRVMDLLRSSSSTIDSTTEKDEKYTNVNQRKERCVIFFPDTHHVATQLEPGITWASENEKNDARLRNVALHFAEALTGSEVEVTLLTDDVACRNLALKEQRDEMEEEEEEEEEEVVALEVEEETQKTLNQDRNLNENKRLIYYPKSVREHISDLEKEDPSLSLSDLVAQFSVISNKKEKKNIYPVHLQQHNLSSGVKVGKLFQGTIRAERGCYDRCYVTVRNGEDRVAVSILGAHDINRAVDGDVVVIALHSVCKWFGANDKNSLKTGTELKTRSSVGIAEETSEPSVRDESNIMDTIEVPLESRFEASAKEEMSPKKPTGKVVGIIRRNFRKDYCGSIYSVATDLSKLITVNASRGKLNNNSEENTPDIGSAMEKENEKVLPKDISSYQSEHDAIANEYEVEHTDGTITCVFFAVDGRVPPVLVRTLQRDRLFGKRILIAIDSWPANSRYPLGHYVKTIGESGDKDVETKVLLHEHKIPCDPFPVKVLACLPPEDYKIGLEPGRIDLRHLPVVSIDPPGCKDIDDALHCIVLPNGNYEVAVHIADVTHYVKAGTPIDLEAANRSTSTYLVNKRLDMLPGLLTTDLCSLKGSVDRFAFSVIWEVTPEADVVDVKFRKSLIHSIAALTYQQAQAMIDQPENKNDIQTGAVKRLASLARKFRARRIAAGALTLASPEVKFVLDSESLNPTDVQSYQMFEANSLVEEFMLLANVTVGKKILRHYPTLSILRRHPAPNRTMFDTLKSKAKCRGFSIDIDDSKRLADSLDSAVIDSDPYFNKLLRILSTRCLSPAQYFCSGEYKPKDWHHYGLAAPVYTHFTSPIRRYADICVHRLLAAAIGDESLPVHLSSKSYLHDLAANMNRRHRAAQLAGRASVQLHTLIVFSGNNGKEEDAYVLDVDTNERVEPSFTVIVPRYGIEGRVHLHHILANDKNLKRNPSKHSIVFKGCSIQVFDKVRVKIWVKSIQDTQKELTLELIHHAFGVTNCRQSNTVLGEVEGKRLLNKTESPQNDINNKKRRRKSR